MTKEDDNMAQRGIWRQRGWRIAAVLNLIMSMLLALALVIMVNFLSFKHGPNRLHLVSDPMYALSEKTRGLIGGLQDEVVVYVFFEKTHGLYDDVRLLLKEYEYECIMLGQSNLNIKFIDPARDLRKTRELRKKYGLEDPNVVVFECKSRCKFVEVGDIIETTPEVDMNSLLAGGKSAYKRKILFMGEMAFSSAIQSVTQSVSPTVYFLSGHGERDINDFSPQVGYSGIARSLRRDNMELKALKLAEYHEVPQDCSVLVVAGPDRKLSNTEVDMLSSYLDRNGRILFLVDPATTTGMEPLLEKWGVRLSSGVVMGLTLRGRELVVTDYGDHPITRKMKNLMTMFYMPRCIDPIDAAANSENVQADRPRVTVLASNSAQGYEEMNLNQNPSKYDEGVDRLGPNPVAVAIEKGAVSGIDIELKPTRMIIIGDSDFVSNGTIDGAMGGNIDLFMSAMNWLVERESIMGISPREPGRLELKMTEDERRVAFVTIVLGIPSIAAFMGLIVWLRRRR